MYIYAYTHDMGLSKQRDGRASRDRPVTPHTPPALLEIIIE